MISDVPAALPLAVIETELAERLETLRGGSTIAHSKSEILAALSEVLTSVEGALPSPANVQDEIESLATCIRDARSDISALRPNDIQDHFIPAATDELDAIVSATEVATNTIMEAAELIERAAEALGETEAGMLNEAATKIYEACSFQDITGQRISKVVGALKEIETRVEGLLVIIGHHERTPDSAATQSGDPDAALLNGPQLPDDANKQDDIDRLFESLG